MLDYQHWDGLGCLLFIMEEEMTEEEYYDYGLDQEFGKFDGGWYINWQLTTA